MDTKYSIGTRLKTYNIYRLIAIILTLLTILPFNLLLNVPNAYACYTWQVGQRVGLKQGAEIRHGPGFGYGIHTRVPENNWQVDIINGPRYADGQEWWDISRRNLDGGGTGWVYKSQAGYDICTPPPPGNIYIASDIELIPNPNHNWPPQEGDKLIGRFTLGNNGGQSIRLERYGIRMRRNNNPDDYWDFLSGSGVDLSSGQTIRFDQNNERSLLSGHYRAEITWKVAGQDWQVASVREFDVAARPNPGKLVLIQDLSVSTASPTINEDMSGSYRVRNVGGQPITLDYLGIQGRLNGDINGLARDFNWVQNLTLQPGEEYSYSSSRSFDISGNWRLRPNYKAAGGDWSDVHRDNGTINEVWVAVQEARTPGYLELVDNLSLQSDGSGSWPPRVGDKLIAHIRVRNGGDEQLHVEKIGVRGRRNGSEFWDIGFWTIDLSGHQEWSIAPNNERPLEEGFYIFRISYSLDGNSWTEIGNEITFTIQQSPPPPQATYSISGEVKDNNNNPIPDVIITSNEGHRTKTDGDGSYTLIGLTEGDYSIMAVKNNYTFSPSAQLVNVPPNVTHLNFQGESTSSPPPPSGQLMRAVIYVPGLNSYSNCDGTDIGSSKTLQHRAPDWINPYLRNQPWLQANLTISHFAYFSYSGRYCGGGTGEDGAWPDYIKTDTCFGIEESYAPRLKDLIKRVTDQNPGMQVTIIAHSHGSLIAAYLVGQLQASNRQADRDFVRKRIASVVNFDGFPQGLPDLPGLNGLIAGRHPDGCRADAVIFDDYKDNRNVALTAKTSAHSVDGYKVKFYTLAAGKFFGFASNFLFEPSSHIQAETLYEKFDRDNHAEIWDVSLERKQQIVGCAVIRVDSCTFIRQAVGPNQTTISTTEVPSLSTGVRLVIARTENLTIAESTTSSVKVTIVTPDGTRVDPFNLPPEVKHEIGLTFDTYEFANPQSGTWSIELFGTDVPETGENITILTDVAFPYQVHIPLVSP
jgi:hypothetical protein